MRVYVASGLGFTEPGRYYYHAVVLPGLQGAGVEPLDPWSASADLFESANAAPAEERVEALRTANDACAVRNIELIHSCDVLLAHLDGTDVESGTASEIGYAAALGVPVLGWRSDWRMSGDNPAATVNLQIEGFIITSGGRIVSTFEEAVGALAGLPKRVTRG